MEQDKTNATRFIDAYNKIDYALRVQNNFKRSMSFSDMIRRAVVVNHIVRKYEDDLIDFGRLRNAIIHKSNDKFIIAEPHIDVVEKICDRITIIKKGQIRATAYVKDLEAKGIDLEEFYLNIINNEDNDAIVVKTGEKENALPKTQTNETK